MSEVGVHLAADADRAVPRDPNVGAGLPAMAVVQLKIQ